MTGAPLPGRNVAARAPLAGRTRAARRPLPGRTTATRAQLHGRTTATRAPLTGLLAVAALVGGGVAPLVAPGAAAGKAPASVPGAARLDCLKPGPVVAPVPWAQKLLAPERAWPLATGSGVTVAVLDSGVDGGHPQLAGRVLRGRDFLNPGNGPGDRDCAGHGTAVASIIAAQAATDTGFHGVAPGVKILPVIVSERGGDDDGNGGGVTPARFGEALRWAVDNGADVVNMSLSFARDNPPIRAAVEYALSRNVVLVAAAGNNGNNGNPTPYPAAYDGVLGVGAVDEIGLVLADSGHGSFVDIAAPGGNVTAATPQRGHAAWSGTSFATPFVAGAAALVRQKNRDLTARQLADRLTATASPAPAGKHSPYYGEGVIDPYRAVADRLVAPAPRVAPTPIVRQVDAAALARERADRVLRERAMWLAGGALLLVVLVLLAVGVRRWGRRQRWRPARAAPIPPPPDDVDDAPVKLFDEVT
ncbi:type VII secretion-associated serine protease mycosin [Rhizomonospora bruguierae]|uniref:type VII secretion-associated serine protease mycosin n=1 Tax=Rhizomonospora bruguierae TaxID=1581705 RepID=UPI0020BE89C9|nr:type VII secretion-associated serine protease mycosin [Micromonospora sp. NBRC 107566]